MLENPKLNNFNKIKHTNFIKKLTSVSKYSKFPSLNSLSPILISFSG